MKILLCNDDGYRAPGLTVLATALRELATVLVVAPEQNKSGASNSLTLDRPLRLNQIDAELYCVDGTPADCIHVAVTELLDQPPDLVVSGINAGENLGDDVIYSGTVAAAMEGAFLGCPAIAVSLLGPDCAHYVSAANAVTELVRKILGETRREPWLLNVNVPDLPVAALKGTRVTRLGQRHKAASVVHQIDPKGRRVLWIGPSGAGADAGPGTDFHAVEAGFVSVTPLHTDLTAYRMMEGLTTWLGI